MPDVLLFGFSGLGLVSYKRELARDTEYFRDVAGLSREIGGVVISGCDTDTYGVYRHSAVVADKGRILGVSDSVYSTDDSEFVAGGNLRVYDTSKGRIGVLVGEDLFFPEAAHTLALCDSELIVSVVKSRERMSEVMAARFRLRRRRSHRAGGGKIRGNRRYQGGDRLCREPIGRARAVKVTKGLPPRQLSAAGQI